MDDWASPWADEEQSQQSTNTRETKVKGTLVTTRLPVNAAILGERINSPWGNTADDGNDEFGDWSLPVEEQVTDTSLRFDQPDGGWHRNVGEQEALADEVLDLTPALNGNATLPDSSVLPPGSMVEHSIRQPSPDPWATSFSEYTIQHVDEDESPGEGFAELDKGEGVVEPLESGIVQTGSPDSVPAHNLEGNESVAAEAESIPSPQSKRDSVAEVDRSSSQPSSSPSIISQHEDGRHESPRTSMEDDTYRPQVSRKASLSIQGLVEQFDSFAKQDENLTAPSSGPAQVNSRQEVLPSGMGDEIGTSTHSKETTSDDRTPPAQNGTIPESPNSMKHSSMPDAESSGSDHTSALTCASSSDRLAEKLFDPINVDVDLSFLDKLFPLNASEPVADIFIPDTIPYDSFGSTEERKMWYRISRYGPMLKHNSGDDENYVRMSWPKSTIRDDTLKIVARWMEEDRLSGHVVLGGGGKTSTLFGWGDSKAPAVSLASAFASRDTRKMQTPVTTLPVASHIVNPTSPLPKLENTPSIPEQVNSIPKPIVNFGWNSVPESVSQSSAQHITVGSVTKRELPAPKIIPPVRTTTLRPMALTETIMPVESPQRTPVPVSGSFSRESTDSLVPIAKLAVEIDEEEDDDWGDMVCTPNNTAFETISFSSDELHGEPAAMLIIANSDSTVLNDEALGNELASRPEQPIERARPYVATVQPVALVEPRKISSPLSSTSGDPWASADFSFLNSSAASLPASASAPSSSPTSALTPSQAIGSSPLQKSVSFSQLPPKALQSLSVPRSHAPAPLSATSKPNSRAREEIVQEELVQSIIKGLPDLSYMLRR